MLLVLFHCRWCPSGCGDACSWTSWYCDFSCSLDLPSREVWILFFSPLHPLILIIGLGRMGSSVGRSPDRLAVIALRHGRRAEVPVHHLLNIVLLAGLVLQPMPTWTWGPTPCLSTMYCWACTRTALSSLYQWRFYTPENGQALPIWLDASACQLTNNLPF